MVTFSNLITDIYTTNKVTEYDDKSKSPDDFIFHKECCMEKEAGQHRAPANLT